MLNTFFAYIFVLQPKAHEYIVVHMFPPLALENHTLKVNGRTHPMVEYVRDGEHEIHDPTRQDLRKQSTLLNSLGVSFSSPLSSPRI
jgi:hypothetical protein